MSKSKKTSFVVRLAAPELFGSRTASKLVSICKGLTSKVTLLCGDKKASGNSLVDLLLLPAERHERIDVIVEGDSAVHDTFVLADFLCAHGQMKLATMDTNQKESTDVEETPQQDFRIRRSAAIKGMFDEPQYIYHAVESSTSPIAFTDNQHMIQYVNDSFKQLLREQGATDVIGMNVELFIDNQHDETVSPSAKGYCQNSDGRATAKAAGYGGDFYLFSNIDMDYQLRADGYGEPSLPLIVPR